ncbi:Transcription factor unc-86, partial [Kappamyces sp. JEL0680]
DALDPTTVADYVSLNDSTGLLSISLFAIGALLSVVTVFGVTRYRGLKIIKQSAFIVGIAMQLCIFVCFFQLILMIGIPTTTICILDSIIIPLTFSFYYGMLFTKSYRLYTIFNSGTVLGKVWTDPIVIMYGAAWSSPCVLILIVWNAIDYPKPSVHQLSFGDYSWTCSSSSASIQSIMYSLLIAYNGLILAFNLLMAFRNRNMTSRYNETKSIAMSIYNVTMVVVFTLPILATTSLNYRLRVILKIVIVFYVSMFNLVSSFTLKIYQCYTDDSLSQASNSNFAKTSRNKQKTASIFQAGRSGFSDNRSGITSFPNVGDSPDPDVNPQSLPPPDGKEGTALASSPSNQSISQSCLVRKVGGLNFFSTPKLKYLLAHSDNVVWITDALKENVEDTMTTPAAVGECMVFKNANIVALAKRSDRCFTLTMDSHQLEFSFQDVNACAFWTSYFEHWVDKSEHRVRAKELGMPSSIAS